MSKAGGKKGAAAKAAAKVTVDTADSERVAPVASKSVAAADMDVKDDVSSNGDKKDVKSTDEANPPKPQSAGASVRDAAQKLLGLTMRQEWTPIEQVIKSLEKAVANSSEEINLSPLAGVLDPVSKKKQFFYLYNPFYQNCAVIV